MNPLIDGELAIPAFLLEIRESFVERNSKHFGIDQITEPLSHNPKVMTEEKSAKNIDEVVASGEDQHEEQTNHDNDGEKGMSQVLIVYVFVEMDNDQSHISTKVKIVLIAILN